MAWAGQRIAAQDGVCRGTIPPLRYYTTLRYTGRRSLYQSWEIPRMKAQDPSLSQRDRTEYLRRYRMRGGFHLATCYP